jgi:hypothetical protein
LQTQASAASADLQFVSDYSVEACAMSVRSEAKDLELISQMPIRLREPSPQGLEPAFFAGLIGTAEEVAEKLVFAPSGAKARIRSAAFIAVLKRCATQNRSCSANSEAVPSHNEAAMRRDDE